MLTTALLIAALSFANPAAVTAQDSDDARFQMIKHCDENNRVLVDSVVQYDIALAAGSLSDNRRDVQDAYMAIAMCYGGVAGHLILALPLPCHDTSQSCLSRTESVTASQAYNCANKSSIRAILNALTQEVHWWQRADAMGTEPGTRSSLAYAQNDLRFYQEHTCRS